MPGVADHPGMLTDLTAIELTLIDAARRGDRLCAWGGGPAGYTGLVRKVR